MNEQDYEYGLLDDRPNHQQAVNVDLSPVEATLVSPHSIRLPADIQDSEDPEDQVIREITREVNRFTDMLDTKHMHSHMRAQMSSRKVQALKALSEELGRRRDRIEGGPLRLMATLLQCVHSTFVEHELLPEQQEVLIQSLAMKLEEAQRKESALKVTG